MLLARQTVQFPAYAFETLEQKKDSQGRDRILYIVLSLDIGQFSLDLGATSLLNYTENLQQKASIPLEKLLGTLLVRMVCRAFSSTAAIAGIIAMAMGISKRSSMNAMPAPQVRQR